MAKVSTQRMAESTSLMRTSACSLRMSDNDNDHVVAANDEPLQ
ncbi:hypothetical protein RBSWK_04991 [Rhodopirellula baltica SWK14]|uniref:Uncharacterized protein n=1 Tax=Rhodopirellula baltica SWK14 TaxID=993516 RepID=L7CAP7_RHOBT|nr:hypothetical protein RBSWK_04991 [Rhodopirellula baltica SWK14]